MENTINIEDSKTAYAYKTNSELKFTYFIFKILQYPKLLKLLTSCANGILNYHLPFKFLIKNTIFKIFCAGENIEEAFTLIKKLEKYNVKLVLDYVSEGEKSEEVFEKNTQIIVANIIKLGKENPGNYISVKISGLEAPLFLKQINGKTFPKEIDTANRFNKLLSHVDEICKAAKENKIIVFIDAEDRYMQDILDKIVETMMEKYNTQSAVVFNTLQMYLKDRLTYLDSLLTQADEKKYVPGIKLVRGAYAEKEKSEALKENREAPVYDTKEQTDAAFNKAVEICLCNHKKVDTCIASHNDKSTLFAVACIHRYKIADHIKKVSFSQLYGMSDNLTFNLAMNGYNVSKYLPYGEIKKAIPYLIRRAEENSAMSKQITGELMRLNKEIWRRKLLRKETGNY